MHDTYCANWNRIEAHEQGLLGYRLTCTKAELHQDRDPADVQALRLRRLRKVVHNNLIDMFDNPKRNPAIVTDKANWSALPECEECWKLLYSADEGSFSEMMPSKATARPTSPAQSQATTRV